MKRVAVDMSDLTCLHAAVEMTEFVRSAEHLSPESQYQLVRGRFNDLQIAAAIWGIAMIDEALVRNLREAHVHRIVDSYTSRSGR